MALLASTIHMLLFAALIHAASYSLQNCSGYAVGPVAETTNTIQADLDLVGPGCAVFGPDIAQLRLKVEYQTDTLLHVLIQDRAGLRYQVPEDILPRPTSRPRSSKEKSTLSFTYTESPFSFRVARKSTGEVLFDTSGSELIFESQFLRIKTWLPSDPNIYGLGEHFDPFRLRNDNYTRTFWARDSDGVPYSENLYGSHPVYFDHRIGSTHGLLLLNSNGMDITLREEEADRHSMEFITIGGVLDFYFLAGPSPINVAQQYAALVGTPAMVPYWSLGFHQCKFGYQDWFQVAEVVSNYSVAGIPLETMWTDIDYLDHRRVFSLDQDRFPLSKMRDIVDYLHSHQQHYILMVDPAVAKADYPAYQRGKELDVFLKTNSHQYYEGVVWPGVAVFPGWYHANATIYWLERFQESFNAESGVDIDGIWIDMNEPANMCRFPCRNPEAEAQDLGMPPKPPHLREPPRPLPGFNISDATVLTGADNPPGFFDLSTAQAPFSLQARNQMEKPGSNLISPPYKIHNGGPSGELSDLTIPTDLEHANNLLEYDIHNLYSTMMGMITRQAMLQRRPNLKPFIISRGSFVGAGRFFQKWLGDNASRWDHYRSSIAGMLAFASIFQIPMVGSDVCGFKLVPSDKLCARWATLGAFSPFYRNHAHDEAPPQEFYLWPLVTEAAKYAISVRYRLLDYLYTALNKQSHDGTPAINPLWYIYPDDPGTYHIDLQYFYGSCLLVSPVTGEDATDVRAYLPDDIFYDFETGEPVRGRGARVHVENVPFDRIPLHVRGGCVIPLRVESANTTAELRKKSFELLVAPGLGGTAAGDLYVDDGVTLDGGDNKVHLLFRWADGQLLTAAAGEGEEEGDGYASSAVRAQQLATRMEQGGVHIERVRVLGEGKCSAANMAYSVHGDSLARFVGHGEL